MRAFAEEPEGELPFYLTEQASWLFDKITPVQDDESLPLDERYVRFTEASATARATLDELGVVTGADYWELAVSRHGNNTALEHVGTEEKYTYNEVDARANQVARWALSQGLRAGDVVAFLCENRPECIMVTMGLAKVGVTAALINTNLTGPLLHHPISISAARHLVVSTERRANWESARALFSDAERPHVWWLPLAGAKADVPAGDSSFAEAAFCQNASRVSRAYRSAVHPRSPMFYIYTSGTTGKSKAAKFSHLRFIGAGLTWSSPCELTAADRYYITLPLYHGNAMVVAMSPVIYTGATAVIRTKFSASNFLADVRKYACTATIYIGELWRYLFVQPQHADDADNPLRVIVGNGLRGDIWPQICARYGIKRVVEHYGATEMPGAAVLNWTNRVGSCGFVPPRFRCGPAGDRVVAYDVSTGTLTRNENGLCIESHPGQEGELLMPLHEGRYDGYVDNNATLRKVYSDVFEKGDLWWASGDLLRIDDEGFYFFVDRAGDAFRWKGENVSTNDVCEIVAAFARVREANVYGVSVPLCEGKAGMASVVLEGGDAKFNFRRFYEHLTANLPSYARPLFLRVRTTENDKTSTFKFQKHTYAEQGFIPSAVGSDSLYFCDAAHGTYVPLTQQVYDDICAGKYRL